MNKGRWVHVDKKCAHSLTVTSISEEQALKTLAYYHANGDENDPLVRFEFEEIKAAITLDKEVSSQIGWVTLFTKKGNLRRLRIIIALAFFSQWSGNGLISYFLGKVMDLLGSKLSV